jgi:hypothetical protein
MMISPGVWTILVRLKKIMERDADREASSERTVLARIAHAPQEQLLGPVLNVLGLEILRDVDAIQRCGASPDATQIRLAVRCTRRGCEEIRLAIGQPRRSRSGIVEPLRGSGCRQQRRQQESGELTEPTTRSPGETPRPTIIPSLG